MKKSILTLASLPLLASAAYAQMADEPLREETIIVTAPGEARAASELIGKATALNRDEIISTLETSLGDTLKNEPGVSTTFFGTGASRPVLRGLGSERVLVLTNGMGVIDASAASPDHQVTADGIDAEKIEILRGPAALAYGGQAIGGVVNVIDSLIAEETPDATISGDAFAAFTSVDEGTTAGGQVQAGFGNIVIGGVASFRDADNFDIPGFQESFNLRLEEGELDGDPEETAENSFLETDTLGLGISFVGDRGFIGISARQQNALYGLPGGHGHGHEGEEHGDEDHDDEDHDEEGEEEENPFIDLEATRYDLRAGYELGESGITAINGSLIYSDYTHTEFEAPGEPGTVFESDGYEGRIEATTLLGDFKGAIGFQMLDKNLDAEGEEAFISSTDTQSTALFVYQSREWDSGVGIEGGLRIEQVELDNVNGGTADFDLVSGSFGLHRHFDSGVFIGGQLSYTERAPNESELFADGPHLATQQFEIGDATLGKESGLNLEGTVRWTGDNGQIGVNVFTTGFNDFIFLAPQGGEEDDLPIFQFTQRDADFFGAEVYANANIDNGPLGADWAFRTSLDFVQAEFDGGDSVPYIPPTRFQVGTDATWGGLTLGTHITVAGDQTDSGEGLLDTEGYQQIDLSAAYALPVDGFGNGGITLFADARNVTDEEIRYSTSVLKDILPAPGRNFRLGVKANF